MNIYMTKHQDDFSSAIEHYKKELNHIRTGIANPELIEGIMVNAYDTMTPINQLANITVPEPKQLLIQPWDKTVSKAIEKAIVNANLGFSPVNEGGVIRLPMPPMTEDNRKELVKLVHSKHEKARISIRQTRDKVKEAILKAEKDNEITEDDKFGHLKQLDAFTSDKNKELKEIADKKAEMILKV